jgi:radical SAM protein with 4Fe4S-binding SPASM domain
MSQEKLRNVVDYTKTYKFVDTDEVLYGEFGEPYRTYRALYERSINYDKTGFIPEAPITLDIEMVNRCNLRCVMCYTDHHKAEKHTQSLDDIRMMIRQHVQAGGYCIQIGMGSEILLYKGIERVLKIAREEGVLDVWMFTNGILLTQKIVDALIEFRIARLNISLDGATRETYKAIRGQDKLDQIERNIEMLLKTKEQRGSKLPILRLTYVVQNENIHECEMFLEKWKDKAGYIDFQRYVAYDGMEKLPWGSSSIDAPSVPAVGNSYCPLPFNCLNVWANGDVTPCCFYYGGHGLVLGNVKEQSLQEMWTGEPLRKVREGLLTGQVNPTCATCIAGRSRNEPLLAQASQAKLTAAE